MLRYIVTIYKQPCFCPLLINYLLWGNASCNDENVSYLSSSYFVIHLLFFALLVNIWKLIILNTILIPNYCKLSNNC